MKAIILTAGEGTRMRPLTFTKPKTMLQVGGKPILQYNVESLRDAGIKDIILVVGYREDVIRDHFKDGSDHGVNITYVTQEKRLGTAHAIGSTRDTVEGKFIILNGDIIVDPVLIKDLIEKYQSENARSVLVLTEVDDPSSFGVVELDGDRITNIIEKPSPGEAPSNLINAGIYLFDDQIFKAIEITEKSQRGEYEITDSLLIQMENGDKILGLKSKNNWIDIGRPWEHFLKNLKTDIQGKIENGTIIHGPVFVGKNTIIRSGSYIMGPVYIGENCDIGPNTFLRKYTCLGNNVNVGNAVEIKNSIIMNNTNVNHLSYVGDSIIGSECNIAAGTNIANLRFDNGNVKIRVKGDKIDSGRRKMGVVFGDGVKTGINSSFNPGVKIGVNSRIGAGAIVSRDLESHKVLIPLQEHHIIDNNR